MRGQRLQLELRIYVGDLTWETRYVSEVADPSLDSGQDVFAVKRYTSRKVSSRLCLIPCSESLPEVSNVKLYYSPINIFSQVVPPIPTLVSPCPESFSQHQFKHTCTLRLYHKIEGQGTKELYPC
jgi:hypothetical protein